MSKIHHDWNPERYSRYAQLPLKYSMETIELLNPAAGMRVLDIGCGEGSMSLQITARGAELVGIDLDPNQVERARQNGIDARVMDAQNLPFNEEFDAAYSNWAIHWIPDHPSFFKSLNKALKPNGRFAAEVAAAPSFGGNRFLGYFDKVLSSYGLNLDEVVPRNFATPERLRQNIEAAGFRFETYMLVENQIRIPGDLKDFVESIFNPIPSIVGEALWPEFIQELSAEMAPVYKDRKGIWFIDYLRHRFLAVKSAPDARFLSTNPTPD